MHEMHLIKDMFADILRLAAEQGAKKITKVHLRMGEFTEINEEIVKFFFREKSRGTILESAELTIEKSRTRELTLVSFDCE
jgi:Zn finger protein HypA/HybF involved in hydrogenase expression